MRPPPPAGRAAMRFWRAARTPAAWLTCRGWSVGAGSVRGEVPAPTACELTEWRNAFPRCLPLQEGSSKLLFARAPLSSGAEETVYELGHHRAPLRAFCVAPEAGLVASGASDGSLRLWRLDDGTPAAAVDGAHGGRGGVTAVAALGARAVATGGADGTVRVWNLDPAHGPLLALHFELRAPGSSPVASLAAHGDSALAVGCQGGELVAFMAAARASASVPGEAGAVTAWRVAAVDRRAGEHAAVDLLAFRADGALLAAVANPMRASEGASALRVYACGEGGWGALSTHLADSRVVFAAFAQAGSRRQLETLHVACVRGSPSALSRGALEVDTDDVLGRDELCEPWSPADGGVPSSFGASQSPKARGYVELDDEQEEVEARVPLPTAQVDPEAVASREETEVEEAERAASSRVPLPEAPPARRETAAALRRAPAGEVPAGPVVRRVHGAEPPEPGRAYVPTAAAANAGGDGIGAAPGGGAGAILARAQAGARAQRASARLAAAREASYDRRAGRAAAENLHAADAAGSQPDGPTERSEVQALAAEGRAAAANAGARARREIAYGDVPAIVDEAPAAVPRRVRKQVAPEYERLVMGLPPPDFGALWDDAAMAPVAGAAPAPAPPPPLMLRAVGASAGAADAGAAAASRAANSALRVCRPFVAPAVGAVLL